MLGCSNAPDTTPSKNAADQAGASGAASVKRSNVLIFGDSISMVGIFGDEPGTGFGNLLADMRPDLDVTIRPVVGETTRMGERRLHEAVGTGEISVDPTTTNYFVLLEGINDTLHIGDDCWVLPELTAARLIGMARFAAEQGFIPIVLTLTPVETERRDRTHCSSPGLRDWRDQVNAALKRLSESDTGRGVEVVNFGDRPELADWWESNPDIHPVRLELREKMAAILSESIPTGSRR